MGGIVFCGYCSQSKSSDLSNNQSLRSIRQLKLVDLPNYVDPLTIKDQSERVKYILPFYRTDITKFE